MDHERGRIVLIGLGNMGKALARGLQRAGWGEGRLFACERTPIEPHEELPDGLDLSTVTVWTPDTPPADDFRLSEADTVVLCTKPQGFRAACETWRAHFVENAVGRPLVISIIAGQPTAGVHEHFAGAAPVVRAMPNIAATVDHSATAICASPSTSEEALERARDIFDAVGRTWIVREDQLDTVTGLSGSGPAYIYMVIEALSDGGVKMGLPRPIALELAAQTVLGAARLVQETGEHPAVLRDQVTTPGGTTICAIHDLESHGLRPMLISAVVTATERSALLAGGGDAGEPPSA